MSKQKEPKQFFVFRILGYISLIVGIILIVLGFGVFRIDYETYSSGNPAFFAPGIILFFISICFLIAGYEPQIQKMIVNRKKYIQQLNKDNLKDIANDKADISMSTMPKVSNAITEVTQAIKKGWKNTRFCKHCGAEIDNDSKFCKDCGKEQE